jgi:hypothetical protein
MEIYASDPNVWHWSGTYYYSHDNEECIVTDDKIQLCFDDTKDCIIICGCSACNGHLHLCDFLHFEKNERNGHCVYCECVDCVCPLRKLNGYYDTYSQPPHWDNLCRGSCHVCKNVNFI